MAIDPISAAAAVDTAKNLVGKLFGSAGEELSLMYGDNIKIRRLKNQIRNFKEIKKIVDEEGITLKQVNLKVLVPYLENMSLEEDEILQKIWANLMVNYLDVSKNLQVTVYPRILGELSTSEVAILEFMISNQRQLDIKNDKDRLLELDFDCLFNLERLGLIENVPEFYPSGTIDRTGDISSSTLKIEQDSTTHYWLTEFGHGFVKACKR